MRRPILVSLSLVAIAGVLVIAAATRQAAQPQAVAATAASLPAFTLHRTDGSAFSERDLLGGIHLVYFGFTTCPDVCPTELGWMARVLRRLGPLAGKVQPVFVTIDPERDTPEKLAAYTAVFDPRFIPLHGSLAEVTAAADAFGVVFRKQTPVSQQAGFYLIDHTMTTFVVGRDGRIVHRLASHELDPEAAAALIRPLAGASP
jgi:protein SCO1/2